jgi:hypothetical protein
MAKPAKTGTTIPIVRKLFPSIYGSSALVHGNPTMLIITFHV